MKLHFIVSIIFILSSSLVIILEEQNRSSDELEIQVYFCPKDNCSQIFFNFINASGVSCALYDLEEDYLSYFYPDARLFFEKDNAPTKYSGKVDKNFALMHNKFCIRGNQVLTGSTNPTYNGLYKNDNNILLITSKKIAIHFQNKFDNLIKDAEKDTFSYTDKQVEIYFCPEDQCSSHLIKRIRESNGSIYFSTFIFTDNAIATELIVAKQRGVDIQGVVEKRSYTQSVASRLNSYNISVKNDSNKATMHHKYFIFDKEIVLTGSYNPTKNGNLYNDENVVILHNVSLANLFYTNFQRLYIQD